MENYYDIATPAELEEHYDGSVPDAKELARQRALCDSDPDYNLSELACLFYGRGDEAAANRCLEHIKNPERRLETSMALYECR